MKQLSRLFIVLGLFLLQGMGHTYAVSPEHVSIHPAANTIRIPWHLRLAVTPATDNAAPVINFTPLRKKADKMVIDVEEDETDSDDLTFAKKAKRCGNYFTTFYTRGVLTSNIQHTTPAEEHFPCASQRYLFFGVIRI